MDKFVIIVAGGSGKRMGNDIPKQFLPLGGKPILIHTIEKFVKYDPFISICLTLPVDFFSYWKNLCELHNFSIPHQIVEGGIERYYSVKNALSRIPDNTLVAVHDGVRPFVDIEVIRTGFEMAERLQAAIPVIPVNESLRQITKEGSKAIFRDEFRIVQTPQCFQSTILKEAYKAEFSETYTDDASIVEINTKTVITLIEGNRENIKITTPMDFIMAEELLKTSSEAL